MPFGRLSVLDTLLANQTPILQLNEQEIFRNLQLYLTAFNAITTEMLGIFSEDTTERVVTYGTVQEMIMEELGETGTTDTQKISGGALFGVPWRRYGGALGWDEDWLRLHTVAELAAQVQALTLADTKNTQLQLRRAFLNPTNYSFTDRLGAGDQAILAVKALANGDGIALPVGPNGEIFNPATHTHYSANATLTDAVMTALIENVVEHYNQGQVYVYINRAQEAAVRLLTGFSKYEDSRVIIGADQTGFARGTLNQNNLYNRAIGVYAGAEVWVKPWVTANYLICFTTAARPLVRRFLANQIRGLRLAAQYSVFPLHANQYLNEFGFGVKNRTAAAVLMIGTPPYVKPPGI